MDTAVIIKTCRDLRGTVVYWGAGVSFYIKTKYLRKVNGL